MLIIRNAKLRNKDSLVDISIENGKFKDIKENIKGEFEKVIDAKGKLVSSPFIESHVHLDSVLSLGNPRLNKSGSLLEAIEISSERKERVTKEEIKENALETIRWLIANGVLYIRTHTDCTEDGLMQLEALLEVKEEIKEYLDIQIVAFPQNGIFTHQETDTILEKSIQMGADVVGALPQVEMTREDGIKSIDYVFNLAKKYNTLIDIHTDETTDDQSRFLEVIAKYTINNEMQGLVTASHTTAMHNYDNDYASKVINLVDRANINIVTNPSSNALLQNRLEGYPKGRGTTRVDELLEAGVNVSIGNDNIVDAFGSFGKANMLQSAHILAHTAHLSGSKDIINLFDMITVNASKTLNLKQYGIKEGNPANFIILDAKDEREAIRLTSEILYVFKNGRVIVETTPAKRNLKINNRDYKVDFKI